MKVTNTNIQPASFDNYGKAVEQRKKLSDKFPDAFVVAVKGNKIVPLQEALEKINQK